MLNGYNYGFILLFLVFCIYFASSLVAIMYDKKNEDKRSKMQRELFYKKRFKKNTTQLQVTNPPKKDKPTFCYSNGILKIIENRKIKFLIHFTNIYNLNNILNEGILPINSIQHSYEHNDELRLDKMHDCVSLSVEHPNEKMFYKCICETHQYAFCVIRLNAKETLVYTRNKKYFFDTNAANSKFNGIRHTLSKPVDFENMFIGSNSKPYLPYDVQAEILFEGTIPIECIDKIYVKNEKHLEWLKDVLGEINYKKNRERIAIKDRYFHSRSYVYWRNR